MFKPHEENLSYPFPALFPFRCCEAVPKEFRRANYAPGPSNDGTEVTKGSWVWKFQNRRQTRVFSGYNIEARFEIRNAAHDSVYLHRQNCFQTDTPPGMLRWAADVS